MTNEQLNHYEALKAAYQAEVDKEIDAGAQLAKMCIGKDEPVSVYSLRVQDAIAYMHARKILCDEARAAVKEFIKAL